MKEQLDKHPEVWKKLDMTIFDEGDTVLVMVMKFPDNTKQVIALWNFVRKVQPPGMRYIGGVLGVSLKSGFSKSPDSEMTDKEEVEEALKRHSSIKNFGSDNRKKEDMKE